MAKFEEVGVTAVVEGYDRFIFQIGTMNKSIVGLGAAGITGAGGIAIATAAIGALVAGAAAAVAVVGGITAALFKLGQTGVETATSFESAFAGVLKTTNNLGTNLYDLTASGEVVFQQFRDLAKEIPLSFEELTKIGEFAGQLGIPEQALADFTRTVAALGVSTELTTEEAALGLARIANVYGVTADDMASNTERMGSTLAFLGNNFAAMEDEILIFARNIAGTTAALGITQDELFAIGTAFTAAGNTAEAGGSSVQRILLEMSKAVQAGGDDLKKWAEATGLTADEFAQQWGEEGGAAKTFLAFMKNLATEGEGASTVLADLDVDTIRVIRTMLSAAGAVDVLESALTGANTAWEQNTALTREAEIRYQTFESQMKIINNRFRDMAATIGFELIPEFAPLLDDVIEPFIEGLEQGLPGAIDTIAGSIRENFVPALTELATQFGLTDPQSVADGIQGIGDAIAMHITNISDFVSRFSEFVELGRSGDLAAAFEAIGISQEDSDFLAHAATDMFDIKEAAKDLVSDKDNLTKLFGDIGDNLKQKTIVEMDKFLFQLEGLINFLDVVAGYIDWFLGGFDQFAGVVDRFAGDVLGIGPLAEGNQDFHNVGLDAASQFADGWSQGQQEATTQFHGVEGNPVIEQYLQSLEDSKPQVNEKTSEVFNESILSAGELVGESITTLGEQMNEDTDTMLNNIEPTSQQGGFDIGVAIMDGMAAGLKAKAEVVARAAAAAVNRVIAAAEAAAGIASPSTEGVAIGENFFGAIGIGVSNMVSQLQGVVSSGINSMVSAGQSILPQTINNNTQSIDRSFNVGDISMITNDKSPISLVDNLSMLAAIQG